MKYLILLLFLASCHVQKPIECPVVMDAPVKTFSTFKTSGLVTIPVVVHIVWNKPDQDISNEQIYSQIDQLNSDFRAKNVSNTIFPAGDCQIEFCLASVDPDGNPTSGITREFTNTEFFTDRNSMKTTKWNPDEYLNIWVCRTKGFNGYGTPEGIIVNTPGFGKSKYMTKPATATHEIGHVLGLRHIWGDEPGCTGTDGIEDTPNQDDRFWQCDLNRVSCGSRDNTQNFMQNGYDFCMVMFTQGQCDVMNSRAQIYASSNGCGMNPPEPTKVEIGYSTDSLYSNLKELENATFEQGTYYINAPGRVYLKVPDKLGWEMFPVGTFSFDFVPGTYLLIVPVKNKVIQFVVE